MVISEEVVAEGETPAAPEEEAALRTDSLHVTWV